MHSWIIDAKAFEYDRHYSECKKNNHPFIKARKNMATKNYLVFLDMATCSQKLSEKDQKQLFDIFASTHTSNIEQHYEITSEFCNFDGILPTQLNKFLVQIYEVAKNQ